MRIEKLWLDGYGRFVNREIAFGEGLQVILGPNEQGKSTLRSFIGDMLYGQKRSTTQRSYDESYELRRPWANPEAYGGRMLYLLDNGHEIEIQRIFDREHESIQVYDKTDARDITKQFDRLRNREVQFAEAHLGLTKAVFFNTATITHLTLENLGDDDALSQIREKLLSLTDTADEAHTSESALAWLQERIAAIGRSTARTKPLPAAKARLAEIETQLAAVTAMRRELDRYERQRQDIRRDMDGLRAHRDRLQKELSAVERHERAGRLAEAEACQRQIDELTQRCFSLGAVRDFDAGQEPELQRLLNVLNTAKTQAQRTEHDRRDITRQLEQERERVGPLADHHVVDPPEDIEQELERLEGEIARMSESIEQFERQAQAARERYEAAQRDLEAVPDFSRLASDPVEWLSQLASTFEMRRQERDRERKQLDETRRALAECEQRIAFPQGVFEPFQDFPNEAEEYKLALRMHDERSAELRTRMEKLGAAAEEQEAAAPHYRNWAIVSLVASLGFILAAFVTQNWGIYIPAGLALCIGCYFLLSMGVAMSGGRRARRDFEDAQAQIEDGQSILALKRETIDGAIRHAGYESIRELEALYERYVRDSHEQTQLEADLDAQEAHVRRLDDETQRAFADVQRTFEGIGIELADEDGVQDAARLGMARYQEYRDAKRRSLESRDQPAQAEARAEALRAERDALSAAERQLALDIRQTMRDQGFREESRHTSALKAVRAYRIRCSQIREKRSRVDLLSERLAAVEAQLAEEQQDLSRKQDALDRFLRNTGAESVEDWRRLADQAREYQTAWNERRALEERLSTLLRGESLEALRASVGPEPIEPLPGALGAEDIRARLAALDESIDERRRSEHELSVHIAEQAGGTRSINEIEEEKAVLERRIADLTLEFEAAVHAAALIENIAGDRHARIAPHLAAAAGGYLSEITDGAYTELLISRDLRISVRIPQTRQLNESPERRLSKGTVDQIYLALRLAFVASLSRNGESIPMLLDDPFSNYDDARLGRALRLLARLASEGQALLFTCHEDVADAAQQEGATVLRL